MTTINTAIRDALGLLGVVAESESLSADQAAHGLRVLNDMMAEWEVNGINVGYYPKTDVADDLPVSDENVAGVKYNLAVELAPYYEREPSAVVAGRASQYYARMKRDAVRDSMVEADSLHMPLGEAASYHRWGSEDFGTS